MNKIDNLIALGEKKAIGIIWSERNNAPKEGVFNVVVTCGDTIKTAILIDGKFWCLIQADYIKPEYWAFSPKVPNKD